MARFRLRANRDPGTQLDWLVGEFRPHLHLPDLGPLYLLMGAVASNMLEGEPVWLMLVGPQGCGKTELLNSLLGLDHTIECADISNPSAFLSATTKKERSREATGGILRQVGAHGGAIINDFTSLLSKEKKVLDAILAVFREIYQGRWTRHVGAEGGRELVWHGKVAFMAGVTSVIDQYHAISATMGERWVYCRMNGEQGSFERGQKVLTKKNSDWRIDLKNAVIAFFAGLDLEFGALGQKRELTDTERVRIIRIGNIGARCRSAVIREPYGSHLVIGAKETESDTRLIAILGQLYIGLELIGVKTETRFRLLERLALDSMPRLRRIVLDLASHREGTGMDAVCETSGCARTTMDRVVEDLEIHDIIRKTKEQGKVRVYLARWLEEEFRQNWRFRK